MENVEIGSFVVDSEFIIASDPCYSMTDWCKASYLAKNGKYIATIKRGDTGLWGVRNFELMVIHEKYLNNTDLKWESDGFGMMVDSGTFGFFDYDYYAEYHSDTDNDEEWYNKHICNINGVWNGKIDNKGVWSSSGLGDGNYELFVIWEDECVVGLKVVFIEEK